MLKRAARKTAAACLCLLITCVFSFASLLLVGPYVEENFWPVVDSHIIHRLDAVAGHNRLMVGGEKVRNCRFLEVGMEAKVEGQWKSFKVTPDHIIAAKLTTEPDGVQNIFAILLFDSGLREVRIKAYHRCHSLWKSRTLIVEGDVEQLPLKTALNHR